MKWRDSSRFSLILTYFNFFMFSLPRILTRQSREAVSATDPAQARIAITEDGMIVYANPPFLTLSGLSQKEIGQRHISSVFYFEDHEGTLQNLDPGLHSIRLHSTGESFSFHFDWLTARNNEIFLIGSIVEHEGAPLQKVASFHHFLKKFENQILQTSQENKAKRKRRKTDFIPELKPFFDLSGDIMIVANKSGEIIQNNGQFTKFFGKAEERPEKDEFINIFHEQDRPSVRNALQTLSLRPQEETLDDAPHIADFEARVVTKDGWSKATEWRAQYLGAYLYCMGRDLSSVKSQQAALNRREKQLSQAESIGRMGHWHWRVGQEEIEWSDQIYNIFGVEPGVFIPSFETMRDMVSRSDIGRVNQAFQRAIIEKNDYDMEFSVQRPDGETRFIRCEGRCSLDEESDVVALYGIMQDMTERMIYERELREAKDAAERAYAAKSQFLANMSHELRTPLNAIIGFSEMMQRQLLGPIGTEKYLEYIGGIRESGEHLLDLISDILDMSKIEAGKYELVLEELSIAKTIETCIHMMQGRAMESQIKIAAEKCGQIKNILIIADRRAVMQILLNVLSNAVKFSNSGGEVTIKCTQSQNGITIQINDKGIGIPPNKLASITRPFEQVSGDYARDHQGSGLGLAITKELVEMHGGILKIESEVNKGTSVSIYFPYNAYRAMEKRATQK